MTTIGSNNFNYFFILLLILCVHQTESKRNKNTGGRRTNSGSSHTTPRSNEHHHYTTANSGGHYHHTTQRHHQDIGFENVQHRVPQQNSQPTQPIGFNVPQHAGNGQQPPASDTFHKTSVSQVGNSNPLNPSAPLAPPPNNPGIGFENVQHRIPSQNNQVPQPGFNVPQNAGSGLHSQPGAPSAPFAPPPNNPGLGFGTPPQSNQPSFNAPPNPGGGYHPQAGMQYPGGGGFQNPHVQHGGSYPGGYPGNSYQNPGQFGGGGIYNPPPYYNPHYASPHGVPPQIYQPGAVQQSSGSSLLGYAGSFAGGYLIGRLTSGGHDSGDRQYTVHHYHHNRDEVPKEISVSHNSVVTCSQNDTQGLCVPNTFPICLSNGTIMCVTHTPYTIPCGINSTSACVISALPCGSDNSTCNNTDNLITTAVYIPCISNVTVVKKKVISDNSTAPSNTTSNQLLNNTNVELCVTAIAEPKKKLESPVSNYLNFIVQAALLPYDMMQMSNSSTDNPINSTGNANFNVTSDASVNKTDTSQMTV